MARKRRVLHLTREVPPALTDFERYYVSGIRLLTEENQKWPFPIYPNSEAKQIAWMREFTGGCLDSRHADDKRTLSRWAGGVRVGGMIIFPHDGRPFAGGGFHPTQD